MRHTGENLFNFCSNSYEIFVNSYPLYLILNTFLHGTSVIVVLFRLHYDSNEELVNWKNAMEESITEGLAEDSVLNDVYENHSNRYCADCGSPGYYT